MEYDVILSPILNSVTFYRKNYRVYLIVLLVSIVINLLLSILLFNLVSGYKSPGFIVTTLDGRLITQKEIEETKEEDKKA